jgi:hypothetical protein
MNYLKILGLAASAAMVITAFTAGSTSAITLEVGGVVQNKAVTIEAEALGGFLMATTNGMELNTCTESKLKGTTSLFTGARVTGSFNEVSFSKCSKEPVVVDSAGGFYIEWEPGTTHGSVYSENAVWTFPTSWGFTVPCSAGTGTKVGTLTGATTAANPGPHALLDISAVVSCGFYLPSATWQASYKITGPTELGVTDASAPTTTLEIKGVAQNKAVTIEAENTSGLVLAKTDGTEANTCSVSSIKGTTSVFTGTKVTGSLSELSFKTCKKEPVVVDAPGGLYIEREAGTTNGNVFSENAKVTVPTSFGFSVTCETAAGTKVGTLTGSAAGHATLAISGVLSCGFLLPSATWKGGYKITNPTGLGVVA